MMNLITALSIGLVATAPVANRTTNGNLRVSFFGDTGASRNSRSVLRLVTDSDLAIHLGDFDYEDSPADFEGNLQGILGRNFPYIAAVGNHDVARWRGTSGYQTRLQEQLNRSIYSQNCTGEYGVNMSCRIGDFHIILSGVGTLGSNHVAFIDEQFRNSDAKWKVCAWHKNQRLFQVGGKSNEVGWGVFESCRTHGAIIMMGHEHSYSRSKVMNNFPDQRIFSNELTNLRISKGRTFAVVNGLGGIGIRDYESNLEKNPWWAKTGASNDGVKYGSLM
jgi:predicted phosphodiesterase